MSHFCLLKEPEQYLAEDWNVSTTDGADKEYWLKHFEDGFAQAMRLASSFYGAKAARRVEAAARDFAHTVGSVRQDPSALPDGRLSVLQLDLLREQVLRRHSLADPYSDVKNRANGSAMKLYTQVVRRLHSLDDREKWLRLVRCVFAGNLFDLGSAAEMNLPHDPSDFLAAAENTPNRPWLVDDFDALAEDLLAPPPLRWGKAVVFVDNAGSDFILGLMPFVRELSLRGVKIVLAANEAPALNDITADETVHAVERLAAIDGDLAALIQAGMLEVVSTGSRIPLIDLSDVSQELNEAAADADLVVLEGMGRAVETNFNAAFRVDSLHLALLKNPRVAARIGGKMYDCVCKYARA